jgi:hypothetical protein
MSISLSPFPTSLCLSLTHTHISRKFCSEETGTQKQAHIKTQMDTHKQIQKAGERNFLCGEEEGIREKNKKIAERKMWKHEGQTHTVL